MSRQLWHVMASRAEGLAICAAGGNWGRLLTVAVGGTGILPDAVGRVDSVSSPWSDGSMRLLAASLPVTVRI